MKSFKQFIQDLESIQEVKGDFGADVKMGNQPKNCYGRTVKYSGLKKKVCSMDTDSGSGGASGDSGGT
jgi:hypothetical protein